MAEGFPNKKVILAMGTILTVIGVMLFPFGYDIIFYFVLDQAGGNYGLAVAWMYTLAIPIALSGIILVAYVNKRKHFKNKWFVFGMIVILMTLMLIGLEVMRIITDFTPAPACP